MPKDPNDPTAGTVTLAVFAIPHSDYSSPAGPPLFAAPGGPGARGIDNYALWLLPALVNAHHDVVSLDPRGTGNSDPIACPGLTVGKETMDEYVTAVAQCGDSLGEASDLYGGAQWAIDFEAVRDQLDYDKVIFYGGSYGGVDAQAYAARYPDRLAGIIIDGGFVVDDPATFYGTSEPAFAAAQVTSACAESTTCTASTKDPVGVLSWLLAALPPDPTREGKNVAADEAGVAVLIDQGMATAVIAAGLALQDGDAGPIEQLSRNLGFVGVPPDGADDPAVFSVGTQAAGWCNDNAVPWDVGAPPETRRAQLDASLAAMPDNEFAPWSKAGWRVYMALDQCLGWPAPSHHEPIMKGSDVVTGVPTLLLVGENDSNQALMPALAARFPGAPVVVVPGAGHPSMESGECIAQYTAEFIESLKVPSEIPCS